ncbi:substrate-binding domain-containing protein [Microbacterium trichothecenolyticum]|uniref:LacI family DNA-binding transcriptional regulator n=1 Tax=Microbacterium trichothecenolyticum TaxID=69370 RepID=UPI001C6EADD0|nr:substrate-binding domain-containing protein [Microbacterium trichothecenolyticum]MBW9119879.1 substrate-binding domain-containing protein [Microbacterium trichothecenolyticum]
MSEPQHRAASRVGVRDVARAAGVSTQTVSRVINEHPNIRPETRDRVLRAIADLGYRVNNAARTLGTRTTRTLGVIASDATLYGPAVGIAALEAAARDAGRWIATAYADASAEASVHDAADRLLGQGVDGLIVLAPHATTLPALMEAHPGIAITALHTGPGAQRQEAGAALAVAHLIELGHRRIGRVAGPEEWLEAQSRERGMLRALAERGIESAPHWAGDWTAAAGAALAPDIAAAVRASDGPTAVAVANDQMALGLIAGLREGRLDVPGDVSIVGFDDNPDAAYYRPALTTVGLDLGGEARRAVAEVLGEAASVPAPPRLVVRASTAPPD